MVEGRHFSSMYGPWAYDSLILYLRPPFYFSTIFNFSPSFFSLSWCECACSHNVGNQWKSRETKRNRNQPIKLNSFSDSEFFDAAPARSLPASLSWIFINNKSSDDSKEPLSSDSKQHSLLFSWSSSRDQSQSGRLVPLLDLTRPSFDLASLF